MSDLISVIIPNHNGSHTIGKCLEAVFSSKYNNFEVIVVDDCSNDNSIEIIKNFPCRLIRLEKPSGAARARNVGASNSSAAILFFTDADCLPRDNALSLASKEIAEKGPDVLIGGTYAKKPYDRSFFSHFQSVFINYFETKNSDNPDYVASHAIAISREVFRKNHGFSENMLPILEDVEFSHRLRRAGYKLFINPDIIVQHIFGYSLFSSLRNAVRKSMYWIIYSIKNRDLLADSGTASSELKINVVSYFLCLFILIFHGYFYSSFAYFLLPLVFGLNLFINKGLLKAFYESGGITFAFAASVYYLMLYPAAVGTGGAAGMIKYLIGIKNK